jgi:hypothetical protein
MEDKPTGNAFQDVHTKIRAAKDKARQASEEATRVRRERAEADEEIVRNDFDRPMDSGSTGSEPN